jgi:hypothetical protein
MKDYKKELENVLDTIKAFGEAYPDNDLIQKWISVNFPSLKRTKLQRLKDAIIKVFSKKEAEAILINEGFQVSEALDLLKEKEEPNFKFKKGDWITRNTEEEVYVFQVIDISVEEFSCFYTIKDSSRGITKVLYQEYIESNYRLWNIDDVYDGDFLVYPDGSITIFDTRLEGQNSGMFKAYALYLPEKDKVEINQTCCILDVAPVTREQRETFLGKLKEKGYKWNGRSIIKINDIFYNWYWFLCTENFTHYDATIFIKGSIYRASDLGIYDANGCFWDFDQFQKDGDSFQNYFKPIVDQDELNKNIKEELINFVKNLYGETDDDIIKKITNDIIK